MTDIRSSREQGEQNWLNGQWVQSQLRGLCRASGSGAGGMVCASHSGRRAICKVKVRCSGCSSRKHRC